MATLIIITHLITTVLHNICYITADTSAANDLIVFNKISIAPDPPVKGKKLTFTVDYDLSEWYTICLTSFCKVSMRRLWKELCESVCVPIILILHAEEEVKGGTVKLSVKMGSINIYSNTLGLCDLLSEAGMSCPVAVDHNGHASFSQVVPSEFPGVS